MKWSKESWSLNLLTSNPVALCFQHHLTPNALGLWKYMWHGRWAFPEQCFQSLMHSFSVAPVHYCILGMLCVCIGWVINIYITHENRGARCQNDSFGCPWVTVMHAAFALLFIFTGACYLYETQPCCLMKFCLFRKVDLTMMCLILLK